MTYLAIFPQVTENYLNRDFFENETNQLAIIAPNEADHADMVKVLHPSKCANDRQFILYANALEQWAFCYFADCGKSETEKK
jgi:hypothetical protein